VSLVNKSFCLKTLFGFTNSCDFKLLHLASNLPLYLNKERTPLEEDLFMKLEDDVEAPSELAEEEKDFLKSLEKMAEEIEGEAESSGKQ